MENKETELHTDINTLVKLDDGITNPPNIVQVSRVESPVSAVENSLSEYVKDAIATSIKDFEFNDAIQQEIISRLSSFNNAELITLLTNNKTGDSDRLSKIIAPSFQLMTAKQQAEIAALTQQQKALAESLQSSANPSDMKGMNAQASKEILQGMVQLQNLLNLMTGKGDATDAVVVSKDEKE